MSDKLTSHSRGAKSVKIYSLGIIVIICGQRNGSISLIHFLPGVGAASDEKASDPIAPRWSCVEWFKTLLFSFAVLPIGSIQ